MEVITQFGKGLFLIFSSGGVLEQWVHLSDTCYHNIKDPINLFMNGQ